MNQKELTDYQLHHRRYQPNVVSNFISNSGAHSNRDVRLDSKDSKGSGRFKNEICSNQHKESKPLYEPSHDKQIHNTNHQRGPQIHQKPNVLTRPQGSHAAKRTNLEMGNQYQNSKDMRQKATSYHNENKHTHGSQSSKQPPPRTIDEMNDERYILEVDNYPLINSSSANKLRKFQIDSDKQFKHHYPNQQQHHPPSKIQSYQHQFQNNKKDLKLQQQPVSYSNEGHSRSNRNLSYRSNIHIQEAESKDIFPKNPSTQRSHRNLAHVRESSQKSIKGKPPLPTSSHSTSRERFKIPTNADQPLSELVLIKQNQSVPAKISAAPSSGQADRRILPQNFVYPDYKQQRHESKQRERESDSYRNKEENTTPKLKYNFYEESLNSTPHLQPHIQNSAAPMNSKHHKKYISYSNTNPFSIDQVDNNSDRQSQQYPSSGQILNNMNPNLRRSQAILTSQSQRNIHNKRSHNDLHSLQNDPIHTPTNITRDQLSSNYTNSARDLANHHSQKPFSPQNNVRNKFQVQHSEIWGQHQNNQSNEPPQQQIGKKGGQRIHSYDDHRQVFQPPTKSQITQVKQIRYSDPNDQTDDRYNQQSRGNLQRQPSNSPADKIRSNVQNGHKAVQAFDNAAVQSTDTPHTPTHINQKKNTDFQYKDDPIQTAQRIMRKQRLSWQPKGKQQSNERKVYEHSQKNNLFIQKHMSEQIEFNNSGFSNEAQNKQNNTENQFDDIGFSQQSHRSKDTISQSSSQYKVKDKRSNVETQYTGTGSQPSPESKGQAQDGKYPQSISFSNQKVIMNNQMALNMRNTNRIKMSNESNNNTPEQNYTEPDDNQNPHGYDFSFQNFNPSSMQMGNELSSLTNREIFSNLHPQMMHSEPTPKDQQKREKVDQYQQQIDLNTHRSGNKEKTPRQSKGINMNIEKYNERRQAKIAKLQIEGMNNNNKQKNSLLQIFQSTNDLHLQNKNEFIHESNTVKQISSDHKLSYNINQNKNLNIKYPNHHQQQKETNQPNEKSSKHESRSTHQENTRQPLNSHIQKNRKDNQKYTPRESQSNRDENRVGERGMKSQRQLQGKQEKEVSHMVKQNKFEIRNEREKVAMASRNNQNNKLTPQSSIKTDQASHHFSDRPDENSKGDVRFQSFGNPDGSNNNSHEYSEFDPNIFKNTPSLQTLQQSFETSLMQDKKQRGNPQILDTNQINNNSRSSSKYGGSERYDSQRRGDNNLLANNHHQKPQPLSFQASLDPPEYVDRFNIITKFAFATSCGYLPNNPHKHNQDTYILQPNMMDQLGLHYFSVCDGHGIDGHEVSKYVRDNLPKRLQHCLSRSSNFYQTEQSGIQKFYSRIPTYIRKSISQIQSELANPALFKYDSQISGTTHCSVLFDRDTVFCSNLGDSRAVLFSYYKPSKKDEEAKLLGKLGVTPLSNDHKPSLPNEKERILKSNGRVDQIKGPHGQGLGPQRVWLKNQEYPGLAMSRSLGDLVAHSIGVSSDPEIIKYDLKAEHKFIVIASDGVTEFLSDDEIGKIVWPYYNENSPENAGNAIVREAASRWRQNDTMIDDITCITIFLEVDPQEKIQHSKALSQQKHISGQQSISKNPCLKNVSPYGNRVNKLESDKVHSNQSSAQKPIYTRHMEAMKI